MLLVALDLRIVIFTTNETLRIKDSVLGVRGVGILGSVTNTEHKTSIICERHKCVRTYSRSSSEKLTHDGVIRWPWSFAIISTRPPRCTLLQKVRQGASPWYTCSLPYTRVTEDEFRISYATLRLHANALTLYQDLEGLVRDSQAQVCSRVTYQYR